MKKYWSFFRIRFQTALQYRAAAIAGAVTQLLWGGMEILAFHAFYTADPVAFPMGFEQLSSYIWLQQAFLALFMMWNWDAELFESIQRGDIAYELVRPIHLYGMWSVKLLANRLAKAALRCGPVLLVAALLPAPYGLSLPSSLESFCLFLLSMALGVLTVVAFGMPVYIASFYMVSSLGLRIVVATFTEFFSGAVIPLPFFPAKLQRMMELLPFGGMQNLPLRVYSGAISPREALQGVGLQLIWLAALTAFGLWGMKRAVKKTVVMGG
ncbi:MAG: ABC transporter permease [Eubacteriales bacterium]|nr:ABC transporter permease [Eubacteriales bacterium]